MPAKEIGALVFFRGIDSRCREALINGRWTDGSLNGSRRLFALRGQGERIWQRRKEKGRATTNKTTAGQLPNGETPPQKAIEQESGSAAAKAGKKPVTRASRKRRAKGAEARPKRGTPTRDEGAGGPVRTKTVFFGRSGTATAIAVRASGKKPTREAVDETQGGLYEREDHGIRRPWPQSRYHGLASAIVPSYCDQSSCARKPDCFAGRRPHFPRRLVRERSPPPPPTIGGRRASARVRWISGRGDTPDQHQVPATARGTGTHGDRRYDPQTRPIGSPATRPGNRRRFCDITNSTIPVATQATPPSSNGSASGTHKPAARARTHGFGWSRASAWTSADAGIHGAHPRGPRARNTEAARRPPPAPKKHRGRQAPAGRAGGPLPEPAPRTQTRPFHHPHPAPPARPPPQCDTNHPP